MNLQQAYIGWSQQQQNREHYMKTKDAFRKAWFMLPTNKPCSYYTKQVLGEALAATREVESVKINAASVMVHVLSFAHFAEPKYNPEPDFTYSDLMEYTKGPLADPAKIGKLPVDEDDDDNDLDIDPVTAMPRKAINEETVDTIKVREKLHVPEIDASKVESKEPLTPCDEHGNPIPGEPSIIVSVPKDEDNDPLAGIDFNDKKEVADALLDQSARIMNDKPKEDMKDKKLRGRQPRKVCKIDPDTLKVLEVYDSISEACSKNGVKKLDGALRKNQRCHGFYWCYAEYAKDFKPATQHPTGDVKKKAATKPTPKPNHKKVEEAIQQLQLDYAPKPDIANLTDEELRDELVRRGWRGALIRTDEMVFGEKEK